MIHDDLKFIQQLHRQTMEAMQKDIRDERQICFLTVRTWKTIFITLALCVFAFVLVLALRWSGLHWHKI